MVTFTEEILDGRLQFLCSAIYIHYLFGGLYQLFLRSILAIMGINRITFQKQSKHLCRSPFLNKLQAWGLQLHLKDAPTQVFSGEICEIFRNTYFEEHLRTTASQIQLTGRQLRQSLVSVKMQAYTLQFTLQFNHFKRSLWNPSKISFLEQLKITASLHKLIET